MKLDKDILNKPGVYAIKNIVTGKIYIGSSKRCRNRLWEHNNTLSKNTHSSTILQRSFNKYGPDSFIYYIIEYCALEDIRKKEKEYITLYKTTDRQYGYNLVEVTDTGGYVYTEERRAVVSKNSKAYFSRITPEEKLRISNIKRHNTNRFLSSLTLEQKKKRIEKAILTTSKQVKSSIGEIFASISEAARCYNVSAWAIAHSCNGGKSRKLSVTFSYVMEDINEASS